MVDNKLRKLIREEIQQITKEGKLKSAAAQLFPKWQKSHPGDKSMDDVLNNKSFWDFVEKNWNAKDEPGKDGEITEVSKNVYGQVRGTIGNFQIFNNDDIGDHIIVIVGDKYDQHEVPVPMKNATIDQMMQRYYNGRKMTISNPRHHNSDWSDGGEINESLEDEFDTSTLRRDDLQKLLNMLDSNDIDYSMEYDILTFDISELNAENQDWVNSIMTSQVDEANMFSFDRNSDGDASNLEPSAMEAAKEEIWGIWDKYFDDREKIEQGKQGNSIVFDIYSSDMTDEEFEQFKQFKNELTQELQSFGTPVEDKGDQIIIGGNDAQTEECDKHETDDWDINTVNQISEQYDFRKRANIL